MLDFLSFNTFIAQDVLIVCYYLGAIFMPLFLYFTRGYFLKKFSFVKSIDTNLKELYSSLSLKNKLIFIASFFMIFFCMQLCWRMIFEAMIGYFDMHNYLYEIKNNI